MGAPSVPIKAGPVCGRYIGSLEVGDTGTDCFCVRDPRHLGKCKCRHMIEVAPKPELGATAICAHCLNPIIYSSSADKKGTGSLAWRHLASQARVCPVVMRAEPQVLTGHEAGTFIYMNLEEGS